MTGIDIRKAIRAAGLNPNHFDEGKIYQKCDTDSVDLAEFEKRLSLGDWFLNEFRKSAPPFVTQTETLAQYVIDQVGEENHVDTIAGVIGQLAQHLADFVTEE